MREIKFRAWDEDDNEWLDELLFNIDGNGNLYSQKPNHHNIILVQFTGVNDSKGKDMYKGDIITWFADGINKIAIVEWKFNGYIAKRIGKDLNGFDREYNFQSFIPIIENQFQGKVIGNIYEDKHLLGGFDDKN